MKKQEKFKRSRIARRLGLHFTAQLFTTWLLVLVIILISLFTIMYYIGNEQLKSDLPSDLLDSLSVETTIEGDSVQLPSFWPDQLKKKGYWLQIINESGQQIYALNVPEGMPEQYSAADLLRISDTRRLNEYQITTLYEEILGSRNLYLLGRKDSDGTRLEEWYELYSKNGQVPTSVAETLSDKAESIGASLVVLDETGLIVQNFGLPSDKRTYGALDLIKMRQQPAKSKFEVSYYYDPSSKYTWLLERPREGEEPTNQPIFRTFLIISVIIGIAILLLSLGLAVWHGYRYGGPLLLFMRGFERMGRGEYEQVFTDKERRKIFGKNNRFRARYKLYHEVIAGFSDMADKLAFARSERLRLEQSREEWMTGISHDLRTPLTTIQGYGHLLESGQFSWNEDELREAGGTIREKSTYMLELLQDFSLTFELKNHTPGEKLEPLELNEFVRRAVLRYVNNVTLQNVAFDFEESATSLRILANPKWFQRLLDNLISNAVKHNPPGTEIVLSLKREREFAFITVRDNGVGMDEETQSRLFDRYYRGTNTDEGIDGVGLGMSIAYAVVAAHKGTIKVESNIGEGTIIKLSFPELTSPTCDTKQ
ncbi:HAMP domain-containing sensor histidine kinase [Paenibacillus sp. J22TS3]|uniref:sensor histidine kinase n=1 Tax=Paenibacillus sp. J22TS3 TaxID=2807192 RepID=UPI001B0FE5BD|nr:HAMP domain-containing sensor histidine kinase [Paenibacillus sp. J22TS3]GIP23109.1 two-component sensor histidine kinase [Paenibacillus sp. J22TS3]